MTDDVLTTMANYKNICNYIHLPIQSGNSEILHKMNRGYSREWYLERIKSIKKIIPNCAISTDIITGFCGETDQQHKDTLSLLEEVEFNFAYMFYYSERPKTLAERKYEDDITLSIKKTRLQEVIDLQHIHSKKKNDKAIGKTYEVLVEGTSKKSKEMLSGRNDQNNKVVFPKGNAKVGEFVNVKIERCTTATLIGKIV
jgi:tRNA-2-methylthio-N6-dimethylallyladenosine synthase